MPQTMLVDVAWRSAAPADPTVRRRLVEEVHAIAWELTQIQALVADADQVTGLAHAFLVPRMELRLPLFDVGRRFRVLVQHLDRPLVTIVDEDGERVADVRMP